MISSKALIVAVKQVRIALVMPTQASYRIFSAGRLVITFCLVFDYQTSQVYVRVQVCVTTRTNYRPVNTEYHLLFESPSFLTEATVRHSASMPVSKTYWRWVFPNQALSMPMSVPLEIAFFSFWMIPQLLCVDWRSDFFKETTTIFDLELTACRLVVGRQMSPFW